MNRSAAKKARRGGKWRVSVLTGVWERHDVARIMYEGLAAFSRAAAGSGWEIRHVVVGSSDEEHRAMAAEHGAEYIDHPNQPLGRKWNAGMRHIVAGGDFDYLMLLGSDDVLSPKLIGPYTQAMEQGLTFFGLPDMYALDLGRGKGTYFPGYQPPYQTMAIGAGRMHSRQALEQVSGNFYSPWVNRGLDTSSRARIIWHGATETILPPLKAILDIKTADNLNAYRSFNKDLQSELSWEDIGNDLHLCPDLMQSICDRFRHNP